MASNDPTAPLEERSPEQVAEYVDNHIIMALDGAHHLHGAERQIVEDYVRDRLVAISDSFQTAEELKAEEKRRRYARLMGAIRNG